MNILIILAFAILLFVSSPSMFKVDRLSREMDRQISRMNACDTDKLDPELEKFKALVHKYNLFCNITIASYAAVAILVILYINL